MADSQTLGQLKNQYRIRFYRNIAKDLPEVQPGTNVLSTIKKYFNEEGGENSPGFSRSLFSDSLLNANTPENIQKKKGSSSTPRMSRLNWLSSTGERNETTIKSPAVNKKAKTPPCSNNFEVHMVSEEEMDDCEADLPLNLVVEKESIVDRPEGNLSRNQIYSSDSSVVRGPPSPASKTSPKKRLSFIDTLANNKAGFATAFANRYKRAPVDDVPTVQVHESVSSAGNPRPSATPAEHSPHEDDEEFLIEDDESINMSFSVNKRSSVGSAKETTPTVLNSSCENQKLQRKVSNVFQGKSPFCLSRGSQPTRKETSPTININDSNNESQNISNIERLEETKMTSPRAIDENQKRSIKSKTVPEQSLSYSKPIQQMAQTNKESELDLEETFKRILDSNREKFKIPRTPRSPKSKAGRPKSSTVSYQMVESESAETASKQSTVQSQTVNNTVRDDKRSKVKDTLCKDKNSFTSHLLKVAVNIEPLNRMDTAHLDLPVVDEDEEFVIHDITDVRSDSKSRSKKTKKNSNDRKKTKKKEYNVSPKIHNVTYVSAPKSDNNVTDSRKKLNDTTDSSPPLKDYEQKKSRSTEVDMLVLQKYMQADVDDQNDTTSLRPKRKSAPPSDWWVVKQAGGNTFEIEQALPQNSPKNKRKESVESKEPSELQSNKEEDYELIESNLGQNEKFLEESEEKSPKTLNARKRIKKQKHIEIEKTTGQSKAKRFKNKNAPKKSQAPAKRQWPTKHSEQLEDETQESDASTSTQHNLNACNLPNEIDSLSAPAIPTHPQTNEHQCSSPQRHKPILDGGSKKSTASGSTEERELQPQHRLFRQSLTSPVYDSAKSTFQSGPVLKTRAVRYNGELGDIVRNLNSEECPKTADQSPMSIVCDSDTNSDALADCIYHANRDEQGNPTPMSVCFNNHFFTSGKCVIKPMEQDGRDVPLIDVLVFYIVQGKILLKLHKSYHHLQSGDFFFIPPGNTFYMRNDDEEEDAELIFTQLKPGSS